ncbi:MAG: carbon-phosphorus lyase complex subunit PhnJ [Dehalococcoidia bacterium]|nr:carbon-phosphorus lyase complex subunit PhnJ [Dehalococcoidia bacterium]
MTFTGYSYALIDDMAKREIRRALLKAVAVPGHQIPFGSREMPIARGWGTGGLQVTLSLLGPGDVVKVIDQGDDAGVNASNLRRLVEQMTGLDTTGATSEASVIQSRHRIPDERLNERQILVLQVPNPEPLRAVERSVAQAALMHAEQDYARMWLALYEDVVRRGEVSRGAGYPVMVNHRYVMTPSPIPRWDVPKLHQADALYLFGAGREKRVYAVPPHTDVVPLAFEDYPFHVEHFDGHACASCGSTSSYLEASPTDDGGLRYRCSDTAYCERVREGKETVQW